MPMRSGSGFLLLLDITRSIAAVLGTVYVKPLVLSASLIISTAVVVKRSLSDQFSRKLKHTVAIDKTTRVPFELYMEFARAGDDVSDESGQFYVVEVQLPDGSIKSSLRNRRILVTPGV
eukprot:NODE_22041_length_725_cov_3.242475.p1 GENE.NODE_22041_length_725_cov_3.242475~~NODE_22041_length_725_cov_3.242475.p1  ORF type:complete len:119 (-),score=10.58 NODE_22041_length_725_cov_3.242475:297-653(-)